MSDVEHIINYINASVDLLRERNKELSDKIWKLEDRVSKLECKNVEIGGFK